jgi:hypothetical protein
MNLELSSNLSGYEKGLVNVTTPKNLCSPLLPLHFKVYGLTLAFGCVVVVAVSHRS